MAEERTYSGDEIRELGLDDWRSMHEAMQARFKTGNFATGLEMVNRIGAAAEEANHHPDLDLRYTHLNVLLMSHDVNAKTQRDLDLARKISEIAADLGVASDPASVSRVEIGLDTWDEDEIRPFWQAVLGLEQHPRFESDLTDPDGDLPTLWFQRTDEHDKQRDDAGRCDEPAPRLRLDSCALQPQNRGLLDTNRRQTHHERKTASC